MERARKLAICSGTMPMASADRVEALAVLSQDPDEMIAQRAAGALLSQPSEAFLAALKRTEAGNVCPVQLFRFSAESLREKPGIADALAQNPNCPVDLVARAAPYLSVTAVQWLLENLERLSFSPILIAALEACTSLTAEQRRELQELRQGPGDPVALEEAVAAVEPDGAKRVTLLQRLARMRVVERVQLALKGNREERMTLIRDPCKVVQRAVLQSARITEREAEAFAAMANLSEEVLRLIAMNRNFIKNYTIVHNLVNNPKTPLEMALHLLPTITGRDLKMLTMNKNVSDVLRTAARRLERQRAQTR